MATESKPTPKVPKTPKPPVPAVTRINELLKKSALANKISRDELESVANLAKALQTFIATP